MNNSKKVNLYKKLSKAPKLTLVLALSLASSSIALAQTDEILAQNLPQLLVQSDDQYVASTSDTIDNLPLALASLFDKNPELEFEQQKLLQSCANLEVSRSEWFPTLNLKGTTGNKQTSTALASGNNNYDDSSLEFRANVFNGFETSNRWSSAKTKLARDQLRFSRKVQDKMYQLVSTYIEVQRSHKDYQAILLARDRLGDSLSKVRSQQIEGRLAVLAVTRLESRFLLIENQLFEQFKQNKAAQNSFYEITGQIPAPELEEIAPYPGFNAASLSEQTLKSLLELAKNHPLSMEAGLLKKIRLHEREAVNAGYYPKVDLIYSYGVNNNTNGSVNIPGSSQTDSVVLLQASLNLFNGFATQQRFKAATYAEEGANYALHDVNNRITRKVTDAWQDLHLSTQNLSSAKRNEKAGQQTYLLYKELILNGRSTRAELANVIEEWMRASIQLNKLEYDTLLASYRLAYEVGKLAYANSDVTFTGQRCEK